jgi:hypothetical protein
MSEDKESVEAKSVKQPSDKKSVTFSDSHSGKGSKHPSLEE